MVPTSNRQSASADELLELRYVASKRIPNHTITVKFLHTPRRYSIRVTTEHLSGYAVPDGTDRAFSVPISKEDFNRFQKAMLSLDFEEIIAANRGIGGLDGSTLTITVGQWPNILSIQIWTIEYLTHERKLFELQNLVKEIFNIIRLEDWL